MSFVRALPVVMAAVILTGSFAAWLFPYERVAGALSSQASAWSGIELRLDDVGPALSWGGVGLRARDVQATRRSGESFVLPSLFVRPAWSPRWLLGEPQFRLALDGGVLGRVDGVAGLAGGGRFDVALEGVRVGVLPLDEAVPGLAMEGHLSGSVDVARDDAGLAVGELDLEFVEGSLIAPGLPLPIPFERLSASITLGGEVAATVHALAISGPVLSATIEGSVERAEISGTEPLALAMQIQKVGRALKPLLSQLGVRVAEAGPTTLEITGTLSRPTFR